MEKVGERLVEERKRLAKTVAGMAEECAVSKQAQINFEKGRQLPGGAYLIAAARLGVDVSYVLTGQRAGGVKPAPTLTAEEETMLGYFRDASKEVRRAALGALLGASAPAGGMHMSHLGDGNVQIGARVGGAVKVNKKGG